MIFGPVLDVLFRRLGGERDKRGQDILYMERESEATLDHAKRVLSGHQRLAHLRRDVGKR